VSVLIGRIFDDTAELDLWVMSCRVFKREMEFAMFDALVEKCQELSIRKIVGVYIPSKKNSLVARHYESLGFYRVDATCQDRELWQYDVAQSYSMKTRYIRRTTKALSTVASV